MPKRRYAVLCNTGNPPRVADLLGLAGRAMGLGWIGQPVQIETPLPPWDRRAVTIRVPAPTEGNTTA